MSDEEDDPFEEFEAAVGDREGDPFESLGESDEGDGESASDDTPEEMWAPDREEQLGGPAESDDAEPTAPTESDKGSEALSSGELAGASDREGDPFESAERAFEEMEVADVDADDVWESLTDAEERGSVTETSGRTYAEVSKHSYCEHCEYFSEPPEVACTHEGTEILEFLDLETVRVVDCPVVAERRALGEQE